MCHKEWLKTLRYRNVFLVSLPDSCSCVIRVYCTCGEDYFVMHFVLYRPQ